MCTDALSSWKASPGLGLHPMSVGMLCCCWGVEWGESVVLETQCPGAQLGSLSSTAWEPCLFLGHGALVLLFWIFCSGYFGTWLLDTSRIYKVKVVSQIVKLYPFRQLAEGRLMPGSVVLMPPLSVAECKIAGKTRPLRSASSLLRRRRKTYILSHFQGHEQLELFLNFCHLQFALFLVIPPSEYHILLSKEAWKSIFLFFWSW